MGQSRPHESCVKAPVCLDVVYVAARARHEAWILAASDGVAENRAWSLQLHGQREVNPSLGAGQLLRLFPGRVMRTFRLARQVAR
jgi:hypothetical protein